MYTKQNFESGQILTAEALNHMEEGSQIILPSFFYRGFLSLEMMY